MLGALLTVFSMWPLICAAKPVSQKLNQVNQIVMDDVKLNNELGNVITNKNMEMATLTKIDRFSVLNANSENANESGQQTFVKNKKSEKIVIINEKALKNSVNSSILLRQPQSNHVTVDTIRAMFMNNKNNHNRYEHNNNNNNKIKTKPNNNTRQFLQQEQMFHQNATTITVATETDVKNKFRSEKPLSELNIEQTASNEWSHNSQNKTLKITFENVETTNNGTSDLCNNQENKTKTSNATVFATNDKNIYKINHFANGESSSTLKSSSISSSSSSSTSPSIQSVFLDYLNSFNETQPISLKSNAHQNELLSRTERSTGTDNIHSLNKTKKFVRNGGKSTNVERIERSANLSITRPTKRIQILIKSRLLQILPDGTVNGTQNDESDYSKYSFLFLK